MLSIEHEDSLLSPEEGLRKAAQFLNEIVIKRAAHRGVVGVKKRRSADRGPPPGVRRVKTAVIGTGFMGRVHLEALRRVEFVDVAAIAGRELARQSDSGQGLVSRLWSTTIASCSRT